MLSDVCVVTVTYGSRADYVERLTAACVSAGVKQVFIFDNGSEKANSERLRQIEASEERVLLSRGEENFGSAGGFKRALKWARSETYCEFIWLLDDDNIPDVTALGSLLTAYSNLGGISSNILVSYRMLQDNQTRRLVHKRDLWDSVTKGKLVGKRTSLFGRICQKFIKTITKKNAVVNFPIVRRIRASWGGLFFEKGVIDIVGYPNEDFYLYGDDFEFSDRLSELGYDIFTVFHSRIVDVDVQLNSGGLFSKDQTDMKAYYSLRNHVYLDLQGKFLSCVLLASGLILFGLFRSGISQLFLKRSFLVIRAVKHGFIGNLGRREV